MRSCNIFFGVRFISWLSLLSSRSMHVIENGRFFHFSRLNNIPSHLLTTLSSPFICLGCFHILAVWVMRQRTWECRYLFEILISIPLGIYFLRTDTHGLGDFMYWVSIPECSLSFLLFWSDLPSQADSLTCSFINSFSLGNEWNLSI